MRRVHHPAAAQATHELTKDPKSSEGSAATTIPVGDGADDEDFAAAARKRVAAARAAHAGRAAAMNEVAEIHMRLGELMHSASEKKAPRYIAEIYRREESHRRLMTA